MANTNDWQVGTHGACVLVQAEGWTEAQEIRELLPWIIEDARAVRPYPPSECLLGNKFNQTLNKDSMKDGWEIKKLGEVCEVICGQDYKQVKDDNGPYPIYGTGGIMGYASQYRCPAKSVIIGRKGSINNPLYVVENFWNVDTAFGVVPNIVFLVPKFFFYFCKNYDFTKHDVSVTIPSLRRTDILRIPIPIPPLPEQERIVSELDCINGILEKKREQIKELDALAQSIFYHMFGDPVTNEKGWEVKKLGEVAEIGDGLHGTPKYDENGTIAFINGTNLIEGKVVITDRTLFVNEIEASKYRVGLGENTVLLSINGTLGKTAIYRQEDVVLGKSACYCKIFTECLNVNFVEKLMCADSFKRFLEDNSSKSTIKNVGLKTIRNFAIILPPLPLQQSFATKIAAIEKQKELIKRSIAEVETLLASRMQHHFG